jgi:hypothetical protein
MEFPVKFINQCLNYFKFNFLLHLIAKFCVIISIRMRWVGYVALMRERRGVYSVWWGNLMGRVQLGDTGADGKVILKWNFRKWVMGVRTGSS